jgi:hypothetical protein
MKDRKDLICTHGPNIWTRYVQQHLSPAPKNPRYVFADMKPHHQTSLSPRRSPQSIHPTLRPPIRTVQTSVMHHYIVWQHSDHTPS